LLHHANPNRSSTNQKIRPPQVIDWLYTHPSGSGRIFCSHFPHYYLFLHKPPVKYAGGKWYFSSYVSKTPITDGWHVAGVPTASGF